MKVSRPRKKLKMPPSATGAVADKTDERRAEELWNCAVEDYPLGDAIGFQSAVLTMLSEVRHAEREAVIDVAIEACHLGEPWEHDSTFVYLRTAVQNNLRAIRSRKEDLGG